MNIKNAINILFKKKKKKQNITPAISFKTAMELVELPVVTFKHKDLKLNMLLDSGTDCSIIDAALLPQISHKKFNKGSKVMGVEGTPKQGQYVGVKIAYEDVMYSDIMQAVDMSVAFSRIKNETGVTLHGILGTKFMTRYKYILDFDKLVATSNMTADDICSK